MVRANMKKKSPRKKKIFLRLGDDGPYKEEHKGATDVAENVEKRRTEGEETGKKKKTARRERKKNKD